MIARKPNPARLPKSIVAALGMLSAFSIWCSQAKAEQFSIRCDSYITYYVSFDTETKRAVYETAPVGTALKGTIRSMRDHKIAFDLLIVAKPKFELVWNESSKKLTWLAEPKGDPSRQGQTSECVRAELRPRLSDYKNIAPME